MKAQPNSLSPATKRTVSPPVTLTQRVSGVMVTVWVALDAGTAMPSRSARGMPHCGTLAGQAWPALAARFSVEKLPRGVVAKRRSLAW